MNLDEMRKVRRKEENAKRAFERRFGKSMLPLKIVSRHRHANGGDCVTVLDQETGSWAEYNISGWRIGRVREHDAMNG